MHRAITRIVSSHAARAAVPSSVVPAAVGAPCSVPKSCGWAAPSGCERRRLPRPPDTPLAISSSKPFPRRSLRPESSKRGELLPFPVLPVIAGPIIAETQPPVWRNLRLLASSLWTTAGRVTGPDLLREVRKDPAGDHRTAGSSASAGAGPEEQPWSRTSVLQRERLPSCPSGGSPAGRWRSAAVCQHKSSAPRAKGGSFRPPVCARPKRR